MRGIALNFIRYEALQSGNNITEKILRVIDEKRRSKLVNLQPEQILDTFTWLELTNLFKKEWHLFEKIFGDKSKFSHQSDIINDRFDAHAKNADLADFALYRRALCFFEGSLAKL